MSPIQKELTCQVCGATFKAFHNAVYCSAECRKIQYRQRYKLRQDKNRVKEERKRRSAGKKDCMTVSDVLRWIQRHYEETGVLLSYGKAVVKIEGGKNNG